MGYRRKIYYVILITITAACVLAGISRHLLGMGSDERNIFGIAGNADSQDTSSGQFMEKPGRFLSMEINCCAADISLEYGDEYSVSCSYSHNMVPDISVEHNKLLISQVDVSSEHILGVRDSDCVLTITVPEGSYVSRTTINLEVGSITINSLESYKYDIHVGTGNILAEGISMDEGNISTDTGSARLKDIHFTDLSLISGSGDVLVTSSDSLKDCTMKLTTDMGDVKVFGQNHYTAYERTSDGSGHLTIDSDTGNVVVNKVKDKDDSVLDQIGDVITQTEEWETSADMAGKQEEKNTDSATSRSETVQKETVQNETVQNETVQNETVQNETVQNETVQNETVQTENLPGQTTQTETDINKIPDSETLSGLSGIKDKNNIPDILDIEKALHRR